MLHGTLKTEDSLSGDSSIFVKGDKSYGIKSNLQERKMCIRDRAIESRCLSLILRQQPVACDLRQISTALKVVTDLERIGDHASDIACLLYTSFIPMEKRPMCFMMTAG